MPAGPTLAVIAREAGVSLSTASKVLNGREAASPGTRRRVQGARLARVHPTYRQEADQFASAAALLGFTGVETQAVSALAKGRGLWKVAGRSFITQHLLHPQEREPSDTDSRMHA
jgi:hypothetical protein